MELQEYITIKINKLAEELKTSGHEQDYIDEHLKYATPLLKRNLPVISTKRELVESLNGDNGNYDCAEIVNMTSSPQQYYFSFRLAKRNGGYREISAPVDKLKKIQRWILDNILEMLASSPYVKSYKNGLSTVANAKFHRAQPVVLRLDIKNFFPSINFAKVYDIFRKAGYNQQVSTMLAELCTVYNSVPQGAPSSPAISNLVLKLADKKIAKKVREHHIRYTRYADDLTFSGDFNPGFIIKFVESLLEQHGFKLNHSKIKIMRSHNRQVVTGIIVNNHKMSVSRATKQELRKTAYYINKFGIISHMQNQGIDDIGYINRLIATAMYVKHVEEHGRQYASDDVEFHGNDINAIIRILREGARGFKSFKALPLALQETLRHEFLCNNKMEQI